MISQSLFDPSALFDNDEEIEALLKTEYSLADFTVLLTSSHMMN